MTLTSAADLAAKLNRSADAVRAIQPRAVKAAAGSAVGILDDEIGRVAPSRKLTPRRIRVGARSRQAPNAVTATVVPVGPVGLIEGDIVPHLIGVGRRRVGAAGMRKGTSYGKAAGRYLYGPSYTHPVRAPIYHPGTKGRHPWQRGHERIVRVVLPRMRNPIVTAVAEVYR